jgi:hypothetical protein
VQCALRCMVKNLEESEDYGVGSLDYADHCSVSFEVHGLKNIKLVKRIIVYYNCYYSFGKMDSACVIRYDFHPGADKYYP